MEDKVESTGLIVLRPNSVTLELAQTVTGAEPRKIHLGVEVDSGDTIYTRDGRSLREARWAVNLVEDEALTSETEAPARNAIGRLSYCEEIPPDTFCARTPETCEISASLSPDAFATLLDCILAACPPDRLTVRVRGLSCGWEPDGSGTEWDTDKVPHAAVVWLAFSTPMVIAADLDR